MTDWKTRWVELNGDDFQDLFNQFEVWQEHWLLLHPEDAPPADAPDDLDEFVGEHFQNLDKYLNDPEVIELMQKHNKVVSLERQQSLRDARSKRGPLDDL
ncbi:MAG TPA: hypothetical protein VFS77_07595 [Pyrinomonadaceae bacterium]|nr:hypothetical protein [Pyrinomonadaceae bacterium]